jgi:hypothetical protein
MPLSASSFGAVAFFCTELIAYLWAARAMPKLTLASLMYVLSGAADVSQVAQSMPSCVVLMHAGAPRAARM